MAYVNPLINHKDILFEIFDLLPAEAAGDISYWDAALHQKTLASCARVCKAFCGPALDQLWCFLEIPTPLFKLLPCVIKIRGADNREIDVRPSSYGIHLSLSKCGQTKAC